MRPAASGVGRWVGALRSVAWWVWASRGVRRARIDRNRMVLGSAAHSASVVGREKGASGGLGPGRARRSGERLPREPREIYGRAVGGVKHSLRTCARAVRRAKRCWTQARAACALGHPAQQRVGTRANRGVGARGAPSAGWHPRCSFSAARDARVASYHPSLPPPARLAPRPLAHRQPRSDHAGAFDVPAAARFAGCACNLSLTSARPN